MKPQILQSFSKHILPGFESEFQIPPFFFQKYLQRTSGEARLRKGGREWPVTITNDGVIAAGWSRFASENGVEVGDIVRLQRVEKMLFMASVFDSETGCSKKKKVKEEEEGDENPASCTVMMRAYNVKYKCLVIPVKFGRRNGLTKKGWIVLTDKEGRRAKVKLEGTRFRIMFGGSGKCAEIFMGLKEGDEVTFEIVEPGVIPVIRVSY